jgi:hypothetical protein
MGIGTLRRHYQAKRAAPAAEPARPPPPKAAESLEPEPVAEPPPEAPAESLEPEAWQPRKRKRGG